MRRSEKEITNKTDIESILQEAFVCHLGLADADMPYVVPMNYGYEDGHIYLHCAKEGKRLDMIKKNNKVCFAIEVTQKDLKKKNDDEPCSWTAEFRSVIGYGTAAILESLEEKRKGMAVIVKTFDNRSFDFPEEVLNKTALIDITITEMTGKKSPL